MGWRDPPRLLMRAIAEKVINSSFERLGEMAVFEPANGISSEVLVISKTNNPESEHFSITAVSEAHIIQVRVADVLDLEDGDRFFLNNVWYRAKGDPIRIKNRLVWEVEAPPDDQG